MKMEDFEVVIGTYEHHILGFKIDPKFSGGGYTLSSTFTDDSHCGAIRRVAVSDSGILASSSSDDSVRMHNLKNRKEIGGLFQHEGSVNCIRFFKGKHMFTASEDNTICLWKSRKWELLRVLKGHKDHVMSFAVHPTGKLGFSVGKDRSFFTWDLTTGKLAFRRKISDVAQDIMFTEDGTQYVLVFNKKIEICSVENTEVVQEIVVDYRINSVCFVQSDIIAIGGDDRHIKLVDTNGKQIMKVDAAKEGSEFTGRVRALSVKDSEEGKLLFIGLSNGDIKICKLHLDTAKNESEELLHYQSSVRLTCMAVYKATANYDVKESGGRVSEVVNEGNKCTNDDDDSGEENSNDEGMEDDSDHSAESEKAAKKKKQKADKTEVSQGSEIQKETVLGTKRKARARKEKLVAKKKKQK